MKQSTSVRVKTAARHEQLYKDMRACCGEARSVFFLCVCVAVQAGASSPEGMERKSERFWSGTIAPDEWAVYYALALREAQMDFAVLEDDARVLQIAEAYADAGMDLLVSELLGPYRAAGTDLALDPKLSAELAWEIMKFIPDRLL